ncbi:MAG: hypothetical protein R3E75_05245 [Steroidobacteraceae bacterium]|nr:hypothetical protein [Nevskiaceae bacterium]MCP5360070.1 hypothetical protein [Nevskiaceae bacterium]MCP5466109.1 hypothetical protein [Nevskiaceae bacterium]MCP5471511.1 hypothetical protein [Nevskiaceae bacterium]
MSDNSLLIGSGIGQPFLRHRARLIDSRIPILAQGGLAALARVRAVLESSKKNPRR